MKGITSISTYTYTNGSGIPFFAKFLSSTFFCAADNFFNPRFNRILFSSANLGVNSLAYMYVEIGAIPYRSYNDNSARKITL